MIRALVGVLLLAVSGPVRADELTTAQVRQEQLQEQLQAAADELAALQTRTAELEARRDELAGQLSALETQLKGSQVRLDDRVRRLYVHGGTSPAVLLLAAESPTDAMERAAFAARLIRDDRAAIQQVSAQRSQTSAVARRLGQQQQALDAAFRRQQEVSAGLEQALEKAAVTVAQLEEEQRREEEARRLEEQRLEAQRLLDEQRRREEAERGRMAEEQRQRIQSAQRQLEKAARVRPRAVPGVRPPPPPRSGARPPPPPRSGARPPPPPRSGAGGGRYACPVVQPRAFSDTWGAPRSGGRRHQGTDIFSRYGNNVVAVVDGVVSLRGYGRSAGWWLVLRGNDGTSYWYLHLQRYAVADGARVSSGQQVGYNGDTGNAQGTPPHVHFEQHPGGGAAVNPYPLLKRVCG